MRAIIAGVLIAVVIAGPPIARVLAYKLRGDVVARCRDGHLFTTVWIPAMPFNSVSLAPSIRLQYCPVGRHWTVVTRVRDSDLTDEERQSAAQHRDVRMPRRT